MDLQPTLHKPIPINTRVRVPTHMVGKEMYGTVIGISFVHVRQLDYIVLLDEPVGEDGVRGITVGGTELLNEQGVPGWTLDG